jgi:RES domain-containing protein
MIAWRLCSKRFPPLTGEGARIAGGRWNEKGTKMVYCAESLSLAALESFVHFDSSLLPGDFVCYELTIPAGVAVEVLDVTRLPADWASIPGPASIQAVGSAWVASGRSAVLVVPSAIIERERNVLLNPDHPDFVRITVGPPSPFVFDARLAKSASPAKKGAKKAAASRKKPAKKAIGRATGPRKKPKRAPKPSKP